MKKTKIIYVHGIKLNRNSKFAIKMIEEFGDDYNHFILNWGFLVGRFFDRYFKENYPKPSGRHFIHKKTWKLRRIFWEFIGDVLIYFTKKDSILEQIQEQVEGEEKVVLVGHSMGCIIIDEFLAKYKPTNVEKVVTMGNPLAIFRLGHIVPENQYPSSWYNWDNYYEHNDWIACKLGKMNGYDRMVTDIEFKAKGIRSFSIMAHTTYWHSKDLHKQIKEKLEQGL